MTTTTREYRLISADSHVNEPPDLWTTRVPEKFKDRAPHMQRFDKGDAWIIEGAADPITFGWNVVAGLAPKDRREWMKFEDIRPGGHNSAERLLEMDQDGVDAEVLYPTPRLSQGIVANTDADFHHACVAAYNDWLTEYAERDPHRLIGLALLPNRGVEGALKEIERVADRPGIGGFVMGCYPNGTLDIKPEDDRVWQALADRGIPISIHVFLSQAMPVSGAANALPGYGRFFDVPNRIVQMIFAGVFDRVPDLRVVIAEVDMGWVPYFKEQIDNNFLRLRGSREYLIDNLPSDYVAKHFSFTYITDSFGLSSAHLVGVENILWSSDYPHISADWPNSWRTILSSTTMLDNDERQLVCAGNAQRIYGL